MEREHERAYQREYMKAWRRRHPDNARKQSEAARRWQLRNPVRNAWNEYRARSARKGLAFDFTADEFAEAIARPCFYCGAAAAPCNGLDRVDGPLGYIRSNVVTACGTCNVAKSDMSFSDFQDWAMRLSAHMASWAKLTRSA
jgi:hypothetical protein